MPDNKPDKKDEGISYNTELISLDKNIGEYNMFNTEMMMKINIFFVLKSDISKKKFNPKNTASAVYGREITEITLVDDTMEFGLTAGMTIKNENGVLNMVINNHTMYQVVLIISFQGNDSEVYKLEPYIFDIVEMKPTTYEGDPTRYYQVILESELTFIARTHHWVSLLKFDQSIKSAYSYENVFKCILNYFKKYISVTSNKQFCLAKDLYFEANSPDTHELVSSTLKKIPGDATIYEAIQIIMQDACTSVWAESDMNKSFQVFNEGAVYVPMFFRDEYSDLKDFYLKAFEGKSHDDAHASEPNANTENSSTAAQDNSSAAASEKTVSADTEKTVNTGGNGEAGTAAVGTEAKASEESTTKTAQRCN